MMIDEAIKDLEYNTEQLEMEIKSGLWIKGSESELCCKEGIALNKQHIEWLTELKEAKRLLKSAVEDINWINEHTQDDDGSCIMRTNSGCSGCPLDIIGDLFCK